MRSLFSNLKSDLAKTTYAQKLNKNHAYLCLTLFKLWYVALNQFILVQWIIHSFGWTSSFQSSVLFDWHGIPCRAQAPLLRTVAAPRDVSERLGSIPPKRIPYCMQNMARMYSLWIFLKPCCFSMFTTRKNVISSQLGLLEKGKEGNQLYDRLVNIINQHGQSSKSYCLHLPLQNTIPLLYTKGFQQQWRRARMAQIWAIRGERTCSCRLGSRRRWQTPRCFSGSNLLRDCTGHPSVGCGILEEWV